MNLAKKAGIMILGQGINVVVNLLFLPYMSRALSYHDYGSYGQTLLIASVITTFLTLGLPQLLNIYLADPSRKTSKVLSNNIITALLLGLIGSVIVFFTSSMIGSWFNNEDLPFLLKIYSLSVLFSIPFSSINTYLIFIGKVRTSVLISIVTNVLKIILVVISIQIFKSLSFALIAIVITVFIQLVIGIYLVRKNIAFQLHLHSIIDEVKTGFPLGMTAAIGIIILYTDSTMISTMLNVKEYAIYRNGAIEVPFVSTLYISIATIILPEVAKLWQKNKIDELFQLKRKVIMNTIYLLYPILIFLIFNAQDIITLYLGEKYSDSGVIFAIFNLTLFIRVNSYSDILIAAKQTKYIMYSYLIVVIMNGAMNYFAITYFGAVGAAISTVLCLILLAALQLRKTLIISHKKLSHLVNFKETGIVIFISTFFGLAIFYSAIFISNSALKLIISFACFSLLILFSFKRFGFYSLAIYENILPNFIVKFIRKKKWD